MMPLPAHPNNGVQFNAPPEHIFADAMARIEAATTSLKNGEGAIMGISTDVGWNAAVVGKTEHGIEVFAWVGKSWGDKIDYGVIVRKTFTLGL
jgi:hypothetical protein